MEGNFRHKKVRNKSSSIIIVLPGEESFPNMFFTVHKYLFLRKPQSTYSNDLWIHDLSISSLLTERGFCSLHSFFIGLNDIVTENKNTVGKGFPAWWKNKEKKPNTTLFYRQERTSIQQRCISGIKHFLIETANKILPCKFVGVISDKKSGNLLSSQWNEAPYRCLLTQPIKFNVTLRSTYASVS